MTADEFVPADRFTVDPPRVDRSVRPMLPEVSTVNVRLGWALVLAALAVVAVTFIAAAAGASIVGIAAIGGITVCGAVLVAAEQVCSR